MAAPGERPRPARLGRDRRLLNPKDFQEILRDGRRAASSLVGVSVRTARGAGRVGIAASAKVGGSVVRNRAKRLIREFFRHTYRGAAPYDIVVSVKPGFADLTYSDACRSLHEVIARAAGRGARGDTPPRPRH